MGGTTLAVLIAVGKVGSIWARKAIIRKGFQTITTIAVMVTVIQINNNKKKKLDEQKSRNKLY